MEVSAENTKMELTERQKYVLYKITTGIRDEGLKEITRVLSAELPGRIFRSSIAA